jgi:predicted DNA-binding transcriptional regulator AlpA
MTGTSVDNTRHSPEPLLSVRDLCLWLSVSRAGVYRLIRHGDLSPIYIDRRPRFAAGDVEAFIDSRRVSEDVR